MVNEKYMEITLEEEIFTYTSYARDLKLSKETENALSGKRSKAGRAKVKSEEFENASKKENVTNVLKIIK